MSIETTNNASVSTELVSNYLKSLVNRFFKILPIREDEDDSLPVYIQSLQMEIIGFKDLVVVFQNDAIIMNLLSILQYLLDNPNCSVKVVRREVFRAISLCNKLKAIYIEQGGS